MEGKCCKDGYIKEESVKMVKRSPGYIRNNQFTGDIHYNITFSCSVCYPSKGDTIICTVKNKNKIGLLAEEGPMTIIIAFQHHPDREIFQNINNDTKILVQISGSRFKVGDDKISVVGRVNSILPT